MSFKSKETTMISVVTPAYNEAENLPILYKRLHDTLNSFKISWEWIIVDDHSKDRTFSIIQELATLDPHIKGIRFARNFGSHTALSCGIHHAKGDCAIVLASDLQDPPELIPSLINKWKNDCHIVWGVRNRRPGDRAHTIGFSRLYFHLMRHIVGLHDMPPTGSDYFLIDQRVINAFKKLKETNVNTIALLTWMGFKQDTLPYDKEERRHGVSGWNIEKKIKIIIDSVTSFTYKPIRFMSYIGFIFAFVGFITALIVAGNAVLHGSPVQGYPSLMSAVLVIGGIQILMIGIVGEYVWRALDEARRRPRYIIESVTNDIQID